jgi:hypothetical protein
MVVATEQIRRGTALIRIIHNTYSDKNHKTLLEYLLAKTSDFYFASPFLMPDFSAFFSGVNLNSLKSVTILTTLKPKDRLLPSKIDSLNSLVSFFDENYPEVSISILVNNSLHGKVYLFKNGTKLFGGIITSANFTISGLSKNDECGVYTKDSGILRKIQADIFIKYKWSHLSKEKLLKCIEEVEEYRIQNPKGPNSNIKLDLTHHLDNDIEIDITDNTTYWLKPVGVTGDPIEEVPYRTEQLHFSNKRPTGVKIDNIIICYAVGHGKLLSVYKVISNTPYRASRKEIIKASWLKRWPWYVKAMNLTPLFGDRWWRNDLFLTEFKDKYRYKYSNRPITNRGGKTLGTLNYGADKVCLSPDFAKYLIKNIQRYSN